MPVPMPDPPDWLKNGQHLSGICVPKNLSRHFLAEYSAANITLCDISGSSSLWVGHSHLWQIFHRILIQNTFKCEQAYGCAGET